MYFLIGLLSNWARSVCIVNGNMSGNSSRVVQIVDQCRLTSKRETVPGRLPIYIRLSVKISILFFCTEHRVKLTVSQYMHSEVEIGNGQC